MATDAKCPNTPQERAYLTFDCEWCDNILGTTPSKDKLEGRLLRQGISRFLDVCEEQHAVGTIFVTAEVAPLVKDLFCVQWRAVLKLVITAKIMSRSAT